jgi:hypothetical protein
MNSQKSIKLFNQALIINAFADHYLTDAFASGHIRVPRMQIQKWATGNTGLPGLYPERRGNVLSMILHDFESRNISTDTEEGLLVQNSMGEEWLTRGDDHLLYTENLTDRGFQIPLEAVSISFKELLNAKITGVLPNGIFQASLLVPFHKDVPLEEKLSPSFQKLELKDIVNSIYSFYPFYFQMLFEKKDFYLFLNNINSIFLDFRKDVESDINTDMNLELRLPNAYIEAYRNVN